MNQVLFPMFIKTWEDNGCVIVGRIEECDVVFLDLHTRIVDYNDKDITWLLLHGKAVATFDEYDRGNMSSDVWPTPLTDQQQAIFNLIEKRVINSVHFCRLLDKNKYYPQVFPYEKPMLHEEPMLTADELFNREFDVVFIANYSPSRQKIAEALQADNRLRTFISIGAKKRDFNDFVNWHKRGKLFISSGAGGFTDERKQNLFSIAGLIQEETDQLLLHPFTHLENCIKISTPPTKQELDTIYEVCNDKERLYEIYKNNYNFMKTYYSKEYIASNILERIKQHLA